MSKNIESNMETYDSIISRAHYLLTQMIYQANHRKDKAKGDPKVGGHPAASASALHIVSALHLIVKSGFDHIANKPHASPADHSVNYLLDLFLKDDLSRYSLEDCDQAMMGLRAYSQNGEPVFQSYHSAYDPDRHNFFPSGSVGIPPVEAGFLAHAYRYAQQHGYKVPEKAHFWAIIGDAEFREGSLLEAAPEFAERECGNLTWIIDYNRQSLDGHRITNKENMGGTDDHRIAKTMEANGWEVIQLRHGRKRLEFFSREGGEDFQEWLENDLDDYELQSLLLVKEGKTLRKHLEQKQHLKTHLLLDNLTDEELRELFHNFGGHDLVAVTEALEASKVKTKKPTVIIAHTLKGWGLKMAANSGNHSALPDASEVEELRQKQGITGETLFARFAENTKEGKFLKKRGEQLYTEIKQQNKIKELNESSFKEKLQAHGEIPSTLDINLKMASYPHTQWMLGQLTSKLTRIANTPFDESNLQEKQKPLKDNEKPFKVPAELLVSMAPDVGTSTNLNPTMDGKIFASPVVEDIEAELNVKDKKTPDLVPQEEESNRFIRFDIAEANVMSCMGAYGKLRDILGIPVLPLMTVYDFFIKRALDQYFYDLYWNSSFILVGTPSGVTLSPEGAQHGWKSDIQIPNQITWEPFYCQELDWILVDAIKRHVEFNNEGRTGVLIRGVTRGADQKQLLKRLKRQAKFKSDLQPNQKLHLKDFPMNDSTEENSLNTWGTDAIMSDLQSQVLAGGYYLIDYRGYAGYEPGDNVVHIFSLGSLTTEAIKASDELLKKGIYANVIVVTSPDLLLGNLAEENDYQHLKHGLGVNADLHLTPFSNGTAPTSEAVSLSGRRIPIVSVHDGEPGLLDNIGSVIGVKQEALAVRKHSKCGRPEDIFKLHGIDWESVVNACGKVLSETALEKVTVSMETLKSLSQGTSPQSPKKWQELWPQKTN